MATRLPTLTKDWYITSSITSTETSGYQARKCDMWWRIKQALTTGLHPWTVSGSASPSWPGSPKFGMDGVDRWTSAAMVNDNVETANRSWIVLRQPSIGTKFELLLDMAWMTSLPSNHEFMYFGVSFANGYGVVNGGTDGSLSSRPTATDQFLGAGVWGGPNTDRYCSAHVIRSTDGECSRVFFTQQCVTTGVFLFEKPANPAGGSSWTTPSICAFSADVLNDQATWAICSTGTCTISRKGAVSFGVHMTGTGWTSSNGIAPWKNPYSTTIQPGEYLFVPCHAFSTATNARGYAGRFADMFLGSDVQPTGTLIWLPNGKALCKFGIFLVPWVGPNPVIG